jgi:predicted metal-dependent hydrolase
MTLATTETIELGEITIAVTRKAIKNVHLSVHPPDGHVTLAAPTITRLDVARAYAITKLGWIRDQRQQLAEQPRETPREYVERESHYLWGRRYLLTLSERDAKPKVTLDHKRITITVRPGSDAAKRGQVLHAWHKALLHEAIPPLIRKWESRLGVEVASYFLQRMKTKTYRTVARGRPCPSVESQRRSHGRTELPGHEFVVAVAKRFTLTGLARGGGQHRVEDALATG